MDPHDIQDRGLFPEDPADPAATLTPDASLCPECEGRSTLTSGDTCPVCEGTGKATGRTGGG